MTKSTLRKHYHGCYRITLTPERFGQITKGRVTRGWSAEVRKTETGELVRCAGFWKTRNEAVEELLSLAL